MLVLVVLAVAMSIGGTCLLVVPANVDACRRSSRGARDRSSRHVLLAGTAAALVVGSGCSSHQPSATSAARAKPVLAELTDGQSVCAFLDRDLLAKVSGVELGNPTPEDESMKVWGSGSSHIGGPGIGASCSFKAPDHAEVWISIIPADIRSLFGVYADGDFVFAGTPRVAQVPGLGDVVLDDAPWIEPTTDCMSDPTCDVPHGWARASFSRQGSTISVQIEGDGAPATRQALPLARAVARQIGGR